MPVPFFYQGMLIRRQRACVPVGGGGNAGEKNKKTFHTPLRTPPRYGTIDGVNPRKGTNQPNRRIDDVRQVVLRVLRTGVPLK